MRPAEALAVGYALLFLGAAIALARRRPAWPTAAALAVSGLAVAGTAPLAGAGPAWLRDWWLLAFLPLAYWMPAPLAGAPREDLERRLLVADSRLGLGPAVAGPLLEISYLMVYPLVPAGLVAVTDAGIIEPQTFWLAVMLSVLPCYGLLPALPTRPPRALVPAPAGAASGPSALRRANLRLLSTASNGWNTLPSGHAAAAAAVAVLVWLSGSAWTPVFAALASAIALGTVRGRYHYAVDTALGVALGLACGFAIGR